ncbi:unnamed protein product [Microthlaspi erraticum]|nr:unnamed protein product [Microthlaspi erraticum]
MDSDLDKWISNVIDDPALDEKEFELLCSKNGKTFSIHKPNGAGAVFSATRDDPMSLVKMTPPSINQTPPAPPGPDFSSKPIEGWIDLENTAIPHPARREKKDQLADKAISQSILEWLAERNEPQNLIIFSADVGFGAMLDRAGAIAVVRAFMICEFCELGFLGFELFKLTHCLLFFFVFLHFPYADFFWNAQIADFGTVLAGLAFMFSSSILLQIVACAIYSNWWPMLSALMYVVVPMPCMFFGGGSTQFLISRDGGGWIDAAKFLTGASTVGSLAIPIILRHAQMIETGAMLIEFTSFFIFICTVMCFHRASLDDDWVRKRNPLNLLFTVTGDQVKSRSPVITTFFSQRHCHDRHQSPRFPGLVLMFSSTIFLQILACAIYSNWWPMLSAVMYAVGVVAVAMPCVLLGRGCSNQSLTDPDGIGIGWMEAAEMLEKRERKGAAKFLTGACTVGGLAIPIILRHAQMIETGAMLIGFTSFFIFICTLMCFHWASLGDDS